MARRVSATRKARREKIRETDVAASAGINRSFEVLVQELNLIDVKSRVIRGVTRRLPFNYAIIGVAVLVSILGFLFLIGGMLGWIIFGALTGGALAQVYGPTGGLALRQNARDAIVKSKATLLETLPEMPGDRKLALFGIKDISKAGLNLIGRPTDLSESSLAALNGDGRFEIGEYAYLGMAVRTVDQRLGITHDDIKRQTWVLQAREKGVTVEQIESTLNHVF